MATRKATYEEKKALEYLNELNEKPNPKLNQTLVPHLQKRFPKLSKSSARVLMNLWVDNYNKDGEYETIKL